MHTRNDSSANLEAEMVSRDGRRPPARRPRFTLKMAVSLLTAVCVLVVASITFAVTYTTGAKSTEDMGARFATSIADAARIRIEDMFAEPVRLQQALVSHVLEGGYMLPSDDPTDFDVLERLSLALDVAALSLRSSLALATMLFDDGSAVNQVIFFNGSQQISQRFRGNARFITNATTKCCVAYRVDEFVLPSMTRTTLNPVLQFPTADARIDGFVQAKSLLSTGTFGLWLNPVYIEVLDPHAYAWPAAMALRNRTHFLGIALLGVSITSIRSFLLQLDRTPNTVLFALDTAGTSGSVVATTLDINFITTRRTKNLVDASVTQSNCASTLASAPPGTTEWTIACRAYSSAFPYAPLNAAANHKELVRPPSGKLVLKNLRVGGEDYFVIGGGIANSYRGFTLSVLVVLPHNDVLGDVIRSRNIAIAAVCCTFVVACAASFLLIHAVLSPLQRVAVHMRQTARLRDVSDDDSLSRLREVHDLQVAFAGMNTAVKSFTRYVPREVVKDLMATGQLCTIQMTPTRCTVLFVDIAGFTTMCERVPTDELSRLVRVYFERMSSMVMTHGGLIDKFIGDCIMAVWGAPFAIGNQETRGALCAAMMERETRVAPLSDEFDAAGESLHVRVGVATGTVLAGNMGSSERMSYTVIGDDVNLAARLESLNKQFNTRVLLAQSTAERVAPVLALRLVHRIRVVGKDAPVKVYEVIGLNASQMPSEITAQIRAADVDGASMADSFSDVMTASQARTAPSSSIARMHRDPSSACATVKLLEDALRLSSAPLVLDHDRLFCAELHGQAVHEFAAAKFAVALATLQELRVNMPSGELDVASSILRDQCEASLKNPPGADFDGAYRATEK
jgi:class 3 adenylate cyclase